MTFRNTLLAALGCGLLGGCMTGETTVLEGPRAWPNERRVLARDWVVPQVQAKEPETHCYRTLGRVDCHSEKIAGEDERRVEDYSEAKRSMGFPKKKAQ